MLFSYPEVLYRSFGSSITFVLDETHWHRINAKVASHVFSLLASVEGTTVCLEIPLQCPPPPGTPSLGDRLPPPPGRPSRATPGLCKGGGGVHREMYCLGCNRHSCTARPGASGQSVVPHNKLPNSIRVRTPFLTACHHWLTNHSIPRPNGLWFLGADAVNWPIH